jgi:uncharacterized protein YbaA (DUF1428 family)
MAQYVDGYVLSIPKRKVASYKRIAQKASKIWREHGALEYRECVGDDMDVLWGRTFPKAFGAKPNETMVFAWVVYRSRAERDRVTGKVMSDPRLNALMDPKDMPFDMKKMVFGGFKTLVKA